MDLKDFLPEELQSNEALSSFEDVASLAKGFIETKKMVGSSLRLPSEHSDEEQRKEIFQKIQKHYPEVILKPDPDNPEQSDEFWSVYGVPADASEYINPEDVEIAENLEIAMREVAKKSNLNREQYKELTKSIAGITSKGEQELTRQREEKDAALRAQWGMAYDQRLDTVSKAMSAFQDENDPVTDELSPAVRKMIYNMSKNMSGEAFNGADVGGGTDLPTPDELNEKLSDLKRSKAYKDMMRGTLPSDEKRHLMGEIMKIRKNLANSGAQA